MQCYAAQQQRLVNYWFRGNPLRIFALRTTPDMYCRENRPSPDVDDAIIDVAGDVTI